MFQKRQKVNIDDTRFIYQTNFSGDPARDRFGSDKRRVNIVIPTVEQAQQMMDMGINVKQTKPNPNYAYEEPFVPTFYVPVTVNMDSKWPPHVYWITLQGKRLLCTPGPSASWTLSALRTSAARQISWRSATLLASLRCMQM